MASADDDSDDRVEETHQERECMACRGSGSVISNLGGTPSTVTCPWCRGTGKRTPDIDAQAGWADPDAAPDAVGDVTPTDSTPDGGADGDGDGGDAAA